MVFEDKSILEFLLGDTVRKSNAHLFVTFALMDRYGCGIVKGLDCFEYMECYLN